MKIFKNCIIYSLDPSNNIYDSVLVDQGKIVKLNLSINEINSLDCETIDLDGYTLFPGFTDSHTHSFEGGLYSMGANLSDCRTIDEVLQKISQSQVIGGYKFAYSLDENSLKEHRFPSRDELDKICPNNPLLLRRVDGHSCVINSKAIEIINFKKKLNDNFNGFLNKELNDLAAHTFHNTLTDEAIISAYTAANKIAITSGLTTVHTMIGDAQYSFNHYPLIKNSLNNFTIDFELYPQFFDVKKAVEYGASRIGGCILADGSFGSYTAALSQPYKNTDNIGSLYQSDQFWDDFVLEAHKNNLQVGVHCIGDRAIDQIARSYAKAQQKDPKDLRHQIIHNELMSDDTLKLMKENNISAVMQPMFDKLWGGKNGFYKQVLGEERALATNRLKTISDSGILLTGSSDWYITTLNILEQLDAAVNIHNPDQRLSVYEALKIYTNNSAKLAHNEANKGSIEVNKIADFTILKSDPIKRNTFKNNQIVGVIKSGELIFV